jgi:hypothetical protein
MATPQKLATQVTQDEEKQNKHSKMCVEHHYAQKYIVKQLKSLKIAFRHTVDWHILQK